MTLEPSLEASSRTGKRCAGYSVDHARKRARLGPESETSAIDTWRDLDEGTGTGGPLALDPDSEEDDEQSYGGGSVVTHDTSNTTSATPADAPPSRASSKHPSDVNKAHLCPYDECQKAFNRPAKLAQHLRSHTNERPFECPHSPCTKSFLRKWHLNHHVKSAHTGERNFACEWDLCGKRFLNGTRLRRHIATHHEGRKDLVCHVGGCGQSFRKHATLQTHIVRDHEGMKPHLCTVQIMDDQTCGARFDTSGQLSQHQNRTHRCRKLECTLCRPDGSLIDDTAEPPPWPSFSTYRELQDHIALTHPPTCETCGLTCASQRSLKSHSEIQHGNSDRNDRKSYVCEEAGCGASFTRKGNLKIHIQNMHTKRKYDCTLENARSAYPAFPLEHMDHCDFSSTYKSDLVEHLRVFHLGLSPKKQRKTSKRAVNASADKIAPSTAESIAMERHRCIVKFCTMSLENRQDLVTHLQFRHGLALDEIERQERGESQGDDVPEGWFSAGDPMQRPWEYGEGDVTQGPFMDMEAQYGQGAEPLGWTAPRGEVLFDDDSDSEDMNVRHGMISAST